ncbi:MAG TPA: hypothetical protein VGJ09_15625 [Bryobacteraceae bacterium]|jgi:hypothetical protein
MRLAGFSAALFAVAAVAQTPAPHGTRIGQVQTVYMEDLPQGILNALDISDRFRDIVDAARGSGAVPAGFKPAPVTKGPRVEFETWVEQPSRDYAESVVAGDTGIAREDGKMSVHRLVRDNFRHTDATYTLTIEAIAGSDTFRVAFSGSTVPFPVAQVLRDGETIALTLANDTRTGRRLVDYIRVGKGPMHARQGVARDVYAEDAELTLSQPRLRVNGIEQTSADLPAAVSAPVVPLDIPGQGKYLVSFKPRAGEGFEKAGEVVENSLVLSIGANTFRIDCADRIATGSGTYNLYARKEPR